MKGGRSALQSPLPRSVQQAMDRLEGAGYQAWLTGGALRDLLRGREPQDYDLASDAPPRQVWQIFADRPMDKAGAAYGVTAVTLEDMQLEIAAFRREGEYRDGRRPGFVAPARSIEEDLARRDFTVNAMAYSPRRGLADPWGGLQDLQNRLIRTVGPPDRRFQEDGLRLLRALRFAAVLDFQLEDQTAQALRRQKAMLRHVSPPRVGQELAKLLCGPGAARILGQFPDLAAQALPQPIRLADGFFLGKRTLKSLAQTPPDFTLRLALLLSVDEESDSRQKARALTKLGFSAALRSHVLQLTSRADQQPPQTEEDLRRLLRELEPEQIRRLLELQKAQGRDIRWAREGLARVLARGDCCSLSSLALGGRDLQALGLKGPAVGQTLTWLLDQVIKRPELNRREDLLALAKERKDEDNAGK